jgi:hypothetical protein
MVARVEVTENLALSIEGGGGIFYSGSSSQADGVDHVFLGSLEGSSSASLASLRAALPRLFTHYFRPRNMSGFQRSWNETRYWIGLVRSEDELWRLQVEDEGQWTWGNRKVPPTSPAVFLMEDQMRVRILMRKKDRPDSAAIHRLLRPLLNRTSATCEIDISDDISDEEGRGFALAVDLEQPNRRGATLGALWDLGDEAQALLQVAEGDEIPRSAALNLLRAGRWDLFKDQPETHWLEAKSEPYDHLKEKLGKQNWRYELAKDVASFANAPEGGLIILGMVIQDRGDGDIIRGHKEFDLRRVRASTYRKYVAQLVYPRVEGFEVSRVEGKKKGYGLAVLVIPSQPETSRPFLVQGTVSDHRVMGSHVLVPARREDDTSLMEVEAIHARLRLGEQAIKGEK